MNFKTVRPQRVLDQVLEQLRGLILRGELKPGARLPAERALATQMGVSRPTVRAAIHKLVTQGLVEHRQGIGTFVRVPDLGDKQSPLRGLVGDHAPDLVELLELRLGLECNAARFAALRATAEDIAFLEGAYEAMARRLDEGGFDFEADTAFHMGIASASGNQMQLYIMKSLHDLIQYGIGENLKRLYEEARDLVLILKHHREILDAIKRRDADGAFEAMRAHIDYVIEYFSRPNPA